MNPFLTQPLLACSGVFHFFGTRALTPEALPPFKERWGLRQVHGDRMVIASDKADPGAFGDGLATDRPGVLLTISTADCVPVLLIDPETRSVAALHAGWRGTVLNIAARGVATLRDVYGARENTLLAGIGPCIGRCCFEVGSDVWGPIEEKYRYGSQVIERRHGEKAYVHLALLNRLHLIEAGVLPDRITGVDRCTVCDPDHFYSYRRDKTRTGSLISGVMIT